MDIGAVDIQQRDTVKLTKIQQPADLFQQQVFEKSIRRQSRTGIF